MICDEQILVSSSNNFYMYVKHPDFERLNSLRNFNVGICSEGGTPVPIPNTEVKSFSADDTWR